MVFFKKLVNNRTFIFVVWILLGVAAFLKSYLNGTYNNYLIFKYVYLHAADSLNLYAEYPQQYFDTNHYGPFFSLLIAPFAILPDYLGAVLWQLANTFLLYFAIKQLPLSYRKVNAVYWIVAHEMLTAMFSFQFNIAIAGVILLSFNYIEKGKNFWAAMLIMVGTFAKLYGIVGLAFFFFVKRKWNFVLWCAIWAIICLVLPMFFFGKQYILQCYQDWYASLMQKQQSNAVLSSMQDVSVMGMIRRMLGDSTISTSHVLLVGMVVFALPYLRIKQYVNLNFRLLILASTLIFAVIFSNSAESPTYIIAFAGIAIWFMIQKRPLEWWQIALFVFAMVLTSFSPSDLFPRYLRVEYVNKYSLKALPCLLIWLVVMYQLIFEDHKTIEMSDE